jgi:flavin reductase (DIM6/NTAB) family NADH-FMN oxidoreductase RutF
MELNKEEITSLDRTYRLKFINSLSGYKGVHLIGTKSNAGQSNLAIFNSIVHISSNPARIGFIMRPLTVSRDTYTNIIATNLYTINHVQESFLKQAHFTSANFDSDKSEFEQCGLKEEYFADFMAPYVAESTVKIGLKLIEDIEMKESKCHLIIGEVQYVNVADACIEKDGQLDFEKTNNVCVTGLNQYSSVKKLVNYPYARTKDLPDFKKKKFSDHIVFDEDKQSYNANILPYGSNISAPSIKLNNLSVWKSRGVSSYKNVLQSKVDRIKDEYSILLDEYNTNDLLYNAKYDFEPIIGEVYHLYTKEYKNENFLSLIHPKTWSKKHLGSYKINSEKVWSKINKEDV